MNVEIGAEAALFPEKEYIKEIFVAMRGSCSSQEMSTHFTSISGLGGSILSTKIKIVVRYSV
jgi:hypothetical protein